MRYACLTINGRQTSVDGLLRDHVYQAEAMNAVCLHTKMHLRSMRSVVHGLHKPDSTMHDG